MELLLETKKIVSDYYYLIYNTQIATLSPNQRWYLYQSLGPSLRHHNTLEIMYKRARPRVKEFKQFYDIRRKRNSQFKLLELSQANRALSWLAILTVKQILPIVHVSELKDVYKNKLYSCDPQKMLETAEAVLLGKKDANVAYADLCNKFYFGLAGVESRISEVTSYAIHAAYDALETTLLGIDESNLISRDFVEKSLIVYTAINDRKTGVSLSVEKYNPLVLSLERKLEFWEWWLTEAIPQAWDLAQASETA
jgi:hypothetical protein